MGAKLNFTEHDMHLIRSLIDAKLEFKEIAEKMECSPSTIMLKAREMGIDKGQHRKKLAEHRQFQKLLERQIKRLEKRQSFLIAKKDELLKDIDDNVRRLSDMKMKLI